MEVGGPFYATATLPPRKELPATLIEEDGWTPNSKEKPFALAGNRTMAALTELSQLLP
jgi:hypothetical protein